MAFDRHSDNSGVSQFIGISNVGPHRSYISAIDGLRAFAVLSVIAYHLKSEFSQMRSVRQGDAQESAGKGQLEDNSFFAQPQD